MFAAPRLFGQTKPIQSAGALYTDEHAWTKRQYYLRFFLCISVVVTRWPGFPSLTMFYVQYIDVSVLLMLREHFKQTNECLCSWKDGNFGASIYGRKV
jgi:hypothetical protein